MPVKKYKPTTPGRRFLVGIDYSELTKKKPEKTLTKPIKKKAGRNVSGRITVRHKGGGHKRKYRVIDFKRKKDDIIARVNSIEYDPNRSCNIALIVYRDEKKNLVILEKDKEIVEKSFRNIPTVTVVGVDRLSVYNILNAERLIFTKKSLEETVEVYGR
ncbi:unnamed protein product [marine sediment metagenome]|uniref:Large ribosomal subunit protein uL2 RNA-binding domain-containing protein n=2 Tax=marine sediment metagenome TaxID=412755 RepID=X1AJY2_9ZZZZ